MSKVKGHVAQLISKITMALWLLVNGTLVFLGVSALLDLVATRYGIDIPAKYVRIICFSFAIISIRLYFYPGFKLEFHRAKSTASNKNLNP